MIMDGGIADAGERNEGALPGLRSGRLDRRSFLFGSAAGLGALGLAGCATSDDMMRAEAAKLYGPAPNEKFPIPAVDVSKIDPKYYRQTVRYDTKEGWGQPASRALRSNRSAEPQLAAAAHAFSRFGFAPRADVEPRIDRTFAGGPAMAAVGPQANVNYRPFPVGPLLGETIRQRTFEAAWRRHTTSDRHPPQSP
jgi:hypothetical protein